MLADRYHEPDLDVIASLLRQRRHLWVLAALYLINVSCIILVHHPSALLNALAAIATCWSAYRTHRQMTEFYEQLGDITAEAEARDEIFVEKAWRGAGVGGG